MYADQLDSRQRSEWLGARKSYVNSTEFANLTGVGWQSELMFWHHKHPNGMYYGQDTFMPTERSAIGKIFERSIADAAKSKEPAIGLGWKMHKDYMYRFNPELRIGASYDYIIDEGKAEGEGGAIVDVSDWGCEIKNIDYGIWADEWVLVDDDQSKLFEPPPKYEFQGQQQRMLDGRPGTVFLVCVGGNRLETLVRPVNKPLQEMMLTTVDEFWSSTKPPKPDFYKDAELLRRMYGEATPNSILDASTAAELQELRELALRHYYHAKQSRDHEKEKKAVQAQILEIAEKHSKVLLPDNGSIDLGRTQGSAPQVITEDMVGQTYGGRAGFRRCQVRPGKPKEEKPKKKAARKKAAAKKEEA